MQRDLQGLRRAATSVERARARRDEKIVEATRAGATRRQVAEASGLSLGKVQKILARLGLVALLVLMFCGSAQASTALAPDSGTSYPYQRWIERSRVPTPDVTLRVIEGHPADAPAAGCARPALGCADRRGAWIFVASHSTPSAARHTFLHELGHVFDSTRLTDPKREALVQLMHPDDPIWINGAEEDFADLYATCARWGQRPSIDHLGANSRTRHLRGCRLIRNA